MGSLTALMSLAKNALDADQTALNTTANNVANQNTAGYTRQIVSFTTSDRVTISGESTGVDATVSSQRSRVLEQRLQQATSTSSAAAARLTALQSVESGFGLSSTSSNASSTELGSALDGFFSALSSLESAPTDAATRQSVLSAAQTLATAFNDASNTISQETSSLNSGIASSAKQIDSLTSTIASLNSQITSMGSDEDAGTLEDQRQEAVKQLSALIGVNSITTENNGLTLTTSTGAVLVSGANAYSVSTTTVNGNMQLVAGDPATLQSGISGGSIGGMLQTRDQDLPSMMSSLDQLANALGNAMNTQNEAGLTPSGGAGGAIFSLPSSVAGSAAQITVAMSSTDGLATAASGEGAAGTSNAIALAKIASSALVSGQTADSFFASFLGALGTTVSAATTDESTASAATTQAQTARDSLSAVSLDEEASALSQFQRSYQAAAKLFSVIDAIMADAINLGQTTTVS
ncbi:flagellar hook-associated protein FlgK [Granulicella cerasi]|uniref:Flagellar hook-associated protein 1 n=1 Tax=Granulicella cerasi TaxID=741063 RepID=A0ABW1Z4G1_9BACT|nr:flagellar hook-associated protein FlgK [Granulicella cerasi]